MDEVAEVREQEHEDMANLSEGFKMTELGPLPEDWRVVAFSEAVLNERFGVGKVRQQEYQKAGRFPIVDQGQKLIAGYWDRLEDVYQGPLPVIIFGDHTRVFKFVDFPFVCGADGTKILVPDISKFFPAFLYFALTRLEIPNRGYNRHFSLLREQRLPCPPLPEQRDIAHVLRTVQRAKEATERVIQATRELKKSLMRYLFTYGPVPMEEAGRVSFKETEIGLVPEHWEVVRLGEIFEIQQGKALSPKSRFGSRMRPFLRTANILWGRIDLSNVDYMHFEESEEQRLALRAGDLLVCEGGDIGRTAIWNGQIQPCYYQNHLHRLRPNCSDVEPTFYMYWMETAWTILRLYGGAGNKTTIPNLSQSRLSSFPIPFPSLSEQRTIARVLRTVDKKLQAEEARKQALEELFKTLLHNLMTGKIRAKDVVLPNVGEGKGDVTN